MSHTNTVIPEFVIEMQLALLRPLPEVVYVRMKLRFVQLGRAQLDTSWSLVKEQSD